MEITIFTIAVSVYLLAIYSRKPKTNRYVEWLKKPIKTADSRWLI